MYLRRVEGPRAVKLPDGSHMTRADLPPADTRRWVARRKAAVVKGVASGLVTRAWAMEEYGLSDEEFDSWIAAVSEHGIDALRATALQSYRREQPPQKQQP